MTIQDQKVMEMLRKLFNYRLLRAREVVENAFRILSQKFQVYHRMLKPLPDNVDNIVMQHVFCIISSKIRIMQTFSPPTPHAW